MAIRWRLLVNWMKTDLCFRQVRQQRSVVKTIKCNSKTSWQHHKAQQLTSKPHRTPQSHHAKPLKPPDVWTCFWANTAYIQTQMQPTYTLWYLNSLPILYAECVNLISASSLFNIIWICEYTRSQYIWSVSVMHIAMLCFCIYWTLDT